MKKLYRILGIIFLGIIFLFLPIGIDKIFMNRFVTNWDMGQWAGFLGSYLGGGIGGIITLLGVWWQLNRTDKKEKKESILGVLKGILYSLDRNLETNNIEYVKQQSFYVLDYYYGNIVHSKFYNSYIYEIFPELIKENYKILFELDFGKEIIDLNELIKNFNQNHKFLSFELKNKVAIIKKIETLGNHLKSLKINNVSDEIDQIKELSEYFSFNSTKKRMNFSEDEILKLAEKIHNKIENLTLIVEVNSINEVMTEEINQLTQYLLSEKFILDKHTNIFKIIEDIKKIREKIIKEIDKIEN